MPSPFPGMDPYVENPAWTAFHFALSGEILRYLAARLSPRYFVSAEERFVVDIFSRGTIHTAAIRPDVAVVSDVNEGYGGVATLVQPPLELANVMPESVPHVTVEIRDVQNRELVTAIEVLPPTNKRGEGYTEYVARRGRVLLSQAHLLEIDLLRGGQRVPMQQRLPDYPYFVFLSRSEKRPLTDVWPIALDQPLPTVPVPLLSGDADIPLDLQAVFTAVYDLLRYRQALNYQGAPPLPLDSHWAAWAEERLRAAGLREGE